MRVLMVDDDEALCSLLQTYLTSSGFVVDTVFNGQAGIAALNKNTYDIVLLDVMLPKVDGYKVLESIRHMSGLPVIMLTAKGDEPERIKGLDAGADDYLTKPFSSRELVARMKALLRRTSDLPPAETIGDLTIRGDDRNVTIGGQKIRLTSVEFEALRVLCQYAGKPVTREHLYRVVLRRENSPYDRSLDTHVSNLRAKLGKHANGVARIGAVRGIGYQYQLA